MASYNIPQINKQINIPYLVKVGYGKFQKIGKYLIDKELDNIALFWGEGLEKTYGNILQTGFKKHKIKTLHKQDVKEISIEDITKTAFNLPPEVEVIIGIGGGKALDYAKYVAHLLKLPFVSVPTTVSNDAFCAPGVSLTVAGRRKSIKSGIPFGVVVDLDIIKTCPTAHIYSGIGDMVSKLTALHDWKIATEKKLSRYNDFASLMAYNSLDLLFLKHTSDINKSEFQRSLVNSLLMSGIAMEMAGTSRPASGPEHLISHALDEVSAKSGLHGLQVGVATYLCALLQGNRDTDNLRRILKDTGFIKFMKKQPLNKDEFIKALKLAPKIKNNYYTILSEKSSFNRALEFLEKDKILQILVE